jgi:hypothetical protein
MAITLASSLLVMLALDRVPQARAPAASAGV